MSYRLLTSARGLLAAALLLCPLFPLSAQAAYASLDASLAPSQNFDLTHWKLTLPSGDDVAPVDLNSGYQYADVFYTDARTGGMVMRCPNLAGTTLNTHYSRTELREMLDPDTRSAKAASNNWTAEQGGWLHAKLRIDHVSTTGSSKKLGRVIIGQIHGPSTEPVRLYYSKQPGDKTGRIYAALETVSGDEIWTPDIVSNADDAGIALGEDFTYQIKLVGTKLTLAVYRSENRRYVYVTKIEDGYLGQNLYFKAGVYNQNNTGDSSDYVQATFFLLEHTH
ncbi:polysaccharide lyase family 7 protein [Solimonas marina]|uniref:Polysaccharide lyase family 7 protein n=1 Tax=Solimonas marina TaxID=2714601 RepID=A0A969W7S4_9GAMM|nr:polysaccharide lyase family 7 protein [Solimonas marina]NKF22271.1 polysaccharide lyase family 7 protein [Solimonas marina]